MTEKVMSDFQNDLWYEARKKTAAPGFSLWGLIISIISLFYRLFRPKTMIRGFGALGTSVYCVDLNKYRDGVNVELLIDQGVRLFMLRVGGPTQWIYGAWKYEVDATFVPYYNRIRAYAKQKGITVWICGYGVYNPWSNEQNNYSGPDPQVKWLKEATRNQLCDLYCWDDEVGTCWMNGKETTITAPNLLKGLKACMEQTFLEMEMANTAKGWHKMPIHYSANWYMKKFAQTEYTTWLDNNNRDVNSRHFLTWRAWLPTTFTETFATIGAMFDKVISPTGIQENAYLRMGSELAADLWQCTFTAKGPWGPAAGIDASISYGPSATIQQFAYNANLSLETTTPPEPPPDDDGDTTDPDLAAQVKELQVEVNDINARLKTASEALA